MDIGRIWRNTIFSHKPTCYFIGKLVDDDTIQPSLLPRMDFSKGIPDDCRSMVVVPTMLTNSGSIAGLVESLEVRFLASRDANLSFALLTDFKDATERTTGRR